MASDFLILGPLEVVDDDRPVALGGPRQRAVLAILLLHRDEAISSDRLIDLVWGERPPATAAKTLQGYVSHLRKALGTDRLRTVGGGYRLMVQDGELDAVRFETLAAAGREALHSGDFAAAAARLDEALAVWRGDALTDFAYEPFAADSIARLNEERSAAREDRFDAGLALGRHRELIGELEVHVTRHPDRERPLAQLMLALYRSGRQTEALDAYRRGRRRLLDDLGLEPGVALRELEQRILGQDPALELPRRPTARPREDAGARTWRHGRAVMVLGGALLLVAAVAAGVTELVGGSATGRVHVAANSVAAIDVHSDRVVAATPVGARPGAIAAGAGSLWVVNRDDATVSRLDLRTLASRRVFSLPGSPDAIAVTTSGAWVAGWSAASTDSTATRIDPQFESVGRPVRIPGLVPGAPVAIAARGDAVWVAPNAGLLSRLDARSGAVVQTIDAGDSPSAIALGDGGVWLADDQADNVTRVDATGLAEPGAVGHGPESIVTGYGAVWVADAGDDSVVRVDPDTRAVVTTIRVGADPVGVTVGAGSVWVADGGDGTVERIDPRANRVIDRITVGGSPQRVVVAGGRAFVTVDARPLPSAGAVSGATVRVTGGSALETMDPAIAYDADSVEVLDQTCARLVRFPDDASSAGAQLTAEVARSLPSVSADGRTYTFTIRRGYRFSPPSGAPVTAQTFRATIERTLNRRTRSPVAGEYADIVGAAAYMAGRARHLSGVAVRGDRLVIHLVARAPDFPARMTEVAMCAVPADTPVDPGGVRDIPMAGPYRIASYVPGQAVVLTRNPSYRGPRPRRPARIEWSIGVTAQHGVARVLAGRADVAGRVPPAEAGRLDRRYGTPRDGRPRYVSVAGPQLDYYTLNTQRPLFADQRLREAVSYAIDRTSLARLGNFQVALPDHATDHYLPPGVPGYEAGLRVYPLHPDLAAARRLAAGYRGRTVVLATCNIAPCAQQAAIVKSDLAAIGLRVIVRSLPVSSYFAQVTGPHVPYDMIRGGWVPDYLDPAAMLDELLAGGQHGAPTQFAEPSARAALAAADRLSGTRRYLAYQRLDAQLTREAPLAAFGNSSDHELLSARIGCARFGPDGLDLGALCPQP